MELGTSRACPLRVGHIGEQRTLELPMQLVQFLGQLQCQRLLGMSLQRGKVSLDLSCDLVAWLL